MPFSNNQIDEMLRSPEARAEFERIEREMARAEALKAKLLLALIRAADLRRVVAGISIDEINEVQKILEQEVKDGAL